jgi:oligoendopeptidase F
MPMAPPPSWSTSRPASTSSGPCGRARAGLCVVGPAQGAHRRGLGRWYEQSLDRYHPLFWAAKAHFSIAGFGFYNYPYLFGYLFSLGVYQQLMSRQAAGEEGVAKAYRALLRDTGRMSAEELVERHLGQDIRKPAFWQGSLALVEAAVARFAQCGS